MTKGLNPVIVFIIIPVVVISVTALGAYFIATQATHPETPTTATTVPSQITIATTTTVPPVPETTITSTTTAIAPVSEPASPTTTTTSTTTTSTTATTTTTTTVPSPTTTTTTTTSTTIPSLSTDTSYDMKVLVIKYFPLTADGQNIDISITGDVGEPYSLIRQRTIDVTSNLKASLEKATSYLGYRNPSAQPVLRYSIVNTYEYTQAVPIQSGSINKPDLNKILTDHNVCNYVDTQGVSEVWLWAYQGPSTRQISPGVQDAFLSISESQLTGPLMTFANGPYYTAPVCTKTYRIYTINYQRGTAEAMESWGHEMEFELDRVNSYLFRTIFQGPAYPQKAGVTGRCGSVHNPPNAREEYDRGNVLQQQSDCLDWNPDSMGALSNASCSNWGCAHNGDADNPALNYMIWNWQNLPGRNNQKTYQGTQLRNWWDVHGDFDNVMASNRRLTVT